MATSSRSHEACSRPCDAGCVGPKEPASRASASSCSSGAGRLDSHAAGEEEGAAKEQEAIDRGPDVSPVTLERATEFCPEFSPEISSVGSAGSGSPAALFARLLSLGLFFGGIAHDAGDESSSAREVHLERSAATSPTASGSAAADPNGFSRAGPAASCASDDFLSRELTSQQESPYTCLLYTSDAADE